MSSNVGRSPEIILPSDRTETIAQLICGGLVVLDNVVVHAIAGNANNPVQEQIRQVKGEKRGQTQPVGCTMPFDTPFLRGIFSTDNILDPRIQGLYRDPAEQTRWFGGVAFLRGAINEDVDHVPTSMISQQPNGLRSQRLLQVYAPVEGTAMDRILKSVVHKGGLPIMTSANISGLPEIVDREQGRQFAQSHNLPYVTAAINGRQPQRPRGSYPAVHARYDANTRQWKWVWVRTGCFAEEILLRLVDNMPAQIDPHRKKPDPKYPNNTLRLKDVTRPRVLRWRTAKGPELRKRLLAAMGITT